MQVKLINIGKKFNNKWVFKDLNLSIETGSLNTIVGKNGSGKSTLIMTIAGYISPTQGNLQWTIRQKSIDKYDLYQHITIASPYLELIEEFTFEEMVRFQNKFKPYYNQYLIDDVIKLSLLDANRDKPISHFSSGMKQRLKLLLGLVGQSDLLLLDEPCSNLDADGIKWYHELLDRFSKDRTVVVASNHKPEEYPGCTNFITIT